MLTKCRQRAASKNFNRQHLSYWLEMLKRKLLGIMKMPTVHRNLDADGEGLSKIVELQPSNPPR